VRLLVDDMDLV